MDEEYVDHVPTVAEHEAAKSAGISTERLFSVMYDRATRNRYREPKTDDQPHKVLICSECGTFDLYERMKELSVKWLAYQGQDRPPFYRCQSCRGLPLKGQAVATADPPPPPPPATTLWGTSPVTGDQIDPDCLGL